MKKVFIFIIFLLIPFNTFASDITNNSIIKINNKEIKKISDRNEETYIKIKSHDSITISGKDIEGIYIVYEKASTTGIAFGNNKQILIGNNGFLHEYVDIKNSLGITNELKLTFSSKVKIADIYVLDKGAIPEYIEIWNPPVNEADLLLFSTHSDDEQLYFAGLLPTYIARGASVQVVYFTKHYNETNRYHEMLHGLYAVGIRNYPVVGMVPDAWSKTIHGAKISLMLSHIRYDDALTFEVQMIRRFKPLVVVGHDENGEYAHGQHILNTDILKKAIIYSNDETYDVESVKAFGTWNVPKTYLHLYNKNKIVMEYDTKLDYFEGKTAYEMSKIGYSKHTSQQWKRFTKWLNGDDNLYKTSKEIDTLSPNEFGLYFSNVGADENKNDMFEHLNFRSIDEVYDIDTSFITINDSMYVNSFLPTNWYYIVIFVIACIFLFRHFKKEYFSIHKR